MRSPSPLILIVDPDPAFRSFVGELFESAGLRTDHLERGDAVLDAAASAQPAAIVLDVNLPGLNGYEVCRELRDAYGEGLPIIFVSSERTEPFDRSAGLLVGADDYLAKPVDPGELLARVRRLIERPEPGEEPDPRLAALTPREHEVLDLLAKGYSQEEIARSLVISPKTVATHIQRVLGKLEVRSRAQAVALALERNHGVSGHALET